MKDGGPAFPVEVNNELKLWSIIMIFAGIGLAIGALMGHKISENRLKAQAIEHGAAFYNPTNDNFQWRELKEK